MLRRFFCAALVTVMMVGSSFGQKPTDPPILPEPDWPPASGLTGETDPTQMRPKTTHPKDALLALIVNWLARNFDLPVINDHPRIELVSSEAMAALRHRGLATDRQTRTAFGLSDTMPLGVGHDIIAIYDDARRTVYLPEGWTGMTPAELSVLVHEMVHHLQNVSGLKFECQEAREKTAYMAQERWLDMFGLNLEDELQIDPFTALVRTTCKY